MLAVSAWHLRRGHDVDAFTQHRPALASWCSLPAILLALGSAASSASIETTYQPMKIAAAEAQWETCQPCSFSRVPDRRRQQRRDPDRRSSRSRTCCRSWPPAPGTARCRAERAAGPVRAAVRARQLRPERVRPVLVDAGHGLPRHRWSLLLSPVGGVADAGARKLRDVAGVPLRRDLGGAAPFLMNTAGWMLTENGRQPWIVQGLMLTEDGVSDVGVARPSWYQPGRLRAVYVAPRRRRRRADAALRAGAGSTGRGRRRPRGPPTDDQPLTPTLTY